ncbi:MAG: hypothetical protein HKL82_12485 [Acidimicrobiaceae bacterium]|nr:hypothetical protein [Acidimicrobiaceae bacterium]
MWPIGKNLGSEIYASPPELECSATNLKIRQGHPSSLFGKSPTSTATAGRWRILGLNDRHQAVSQLVDHSEESDLSRSEQNVRDPQSVGDHEGL